MSETKLRTALIGLDDRGLLLLEAVSKTDYFDILAVADKNTELAQKVSAQYKCVGYDDYRQLIIQNQFDCLLVAAGLHSCDEYVRMGMKKKFNVLKLSPLARNFEEAAGLVRLAEDENVKFAVANSVRFAQSFLELHKAVQEENRQPVFLITAVCTVGNQCHPAWQNDPKLAGGGVLLHNCYAIIDQIVWGFGLPQQVYCLNTNTAGDRQQRLCLTEDTAVITMKFTDSSFCNIITSKTFGPEHQVLNVYSKSKILTATNTRFVVSDSSGQVDKENEYNDDEVSCMRKVAENFALSILSPDKNKLCSDCRQDLMNMAVVESAYLSARTGMAEEPARILKMSSPLASETEGI